MKKYSLLMANAMVTALLVLGGGLWPLEGVAEHLKDPTRPLFESVGVGASTGEERLKLESILIAGNRKVAVINGEAVGETQTIAGARIEKILPEKVIVLHQGKQKSLILMAPIKLKSPVKTLRR